MISEDNYIFTFREKMTDLLLKWVSDPRSVRPKAMQNKLLSDLKKERPSLSVSRPSKRISWGISVPGREDQTMYVWLDALTNYLTVIGLDRIDTGNKEAMNILKENIKQSVHFVGKDITKFHCIHWPSFLACAFHPDLSEKLHSDYPLPKLVYNHYHWLKDKRKMSKSLGNVVDPNDVIDTYGIDAVRYYFLGYGPQTKDMDFEFDKLQDVHN
mmetsp:Transcript_9649/g.14679  ORF Transcript_9649/g.14679 Transcript_9649/m.14679 type:complete len:213 (-) Transcript_9649:533-1171(-)